MRPRHKKRRLDLWGHLGEARDRLVSVLLAVLTLSAVAFAYRGAVFAWLAAPAGPLHYLGPADAIMAQLKVSFGLGFLAALPWLAWNLWSFVAPAWEPGLARRAGWALGVGVLLFWGGAALGWLLLQQGLKFLAEYQLPGLQPLLTVDRYLGFLFSLCLGCGAVFELPVAVYWLARNGLINRADLLYRWREATLVALVLAAILTPSPDAFSQILLFVPLLALFGVSVWVAGWAEAAPALTPEPWRPGSPELR